MNTFTISNSFVDIGCEECNSYLGRMDVFKNEKGFPTIFSKIGKKGSNFYFGGQTVLQQKGENSFIYVTSMLS